MTPMIARPLRPADRLDPRSGRQVDFAPGAAAGRLGGRRKPHRGAAGGRGRAGDGGRGGARSGAEVQRDDDGVWRVFGRGVGGLVEADRVLDMGNSGTGVRLLMGLVASQPFLTFFSGDASLSRRPMMRVTEPLSRMGADNMGARAAAGCRWRCAAPRRRCRSSTRCRWPRRK